MLTRGKKLGYMKNSRFFLPLHRFSTKKRRFKPAALYRAPLGISSIMKTPVKERGESERARSRIRSQKNAQSWTAQSWTAGSCCHELKEWWVQNTHISKGEDFWISVWINIRFWNAVHIGFCDYGLSGPSGFSDRKPLDGPPEVHK